MWDVVIIGAGMAGLSTAIWARRLGLSALVLERESEPGGQLTAIGGRIVDYPGLDLPEGAHLVQRLVEQAREAGAELQLDRPVQSVDGSALRCQTARGPVAGKSLVIATGITARRLNCPGEEELYQRRLVRRPSHDLAWFAGKRVAVIGGGDRAAENALMLAGVARQVLLLHRGPQLRARREFSDPVLSHPAILVCLNSPVDRFTLSGQAVTIQTPPGDWEADGVCIYIGNRPHSELVAGQVELDAEGYIRTDRHGQTSQPGIFAAGDVCTPPAFQSLSTAAGQAMMVAKSISLHLQG